MLSKNRGYYPNNSGNRRRNKPNKPKIGHKISKEMENSSIVASFKEIADELDTKHNKYERILKYGRDITMESKRIIFQLHNIDKDNSREATLKDARERLDKLTEVMFKLIAFELEGEDPYQFYRAYNYGLQEFIEATTLYQYFSNEKIEGWEAIEPKLRYVVCDDPLINALEKRTSTNGDDEGESSSVAEISPTSQRVVKTREIRTLLPPLEYILALGDLSGELMRKSINNIAVGDVDNSFVICKFVRQLYACFLTLHNLHGKEIARKIHSLKLNLKKIENVCFTVTIRGNETPKHMLLSNTVLSNSDSSIENGDEHGHDDLY